MKYLCFFLLGLTLVSSHGAPSYKLSSSRVWHGKNGKHFRGTFARREGHVLHINSSSGKMYKVSMFTLSADDKKWFDRAWEIHQQKINHVEGLARPGEVRAVDDPAKLDTVAPVGFKDVPDGTVNRLNIPLVDQGEYFDKDFGSMGSALVPLMLWWHLAKVIDVPSRRDDEERRIKWLYKELNKLQYHDYRPARIFQAFFQDELKCNSMFRMLEIEECDPATLSLYTEGANATVLVMSAQKGTRDEGTWRVPLTSCDDQGNVLFQMYGLKVAGKMTLIPPDLKSRKGAERKPRYRITITNSEVHPDWFTDREYSFVPNKMLVLIPYLSAAVEQK